LPCYIDDGSLSDITNLTRARDAVHGPRSRGEEGKMTLDDCDCDYVLDCWPPHDPDYDDDIDVRVLAISDQGLVFLADRVTWTEQTAHGRVGTARLGTFRELEDAAMDAGLIVGEGNIDCDEGKPFVIDFLHKNLSS
jgi:hypothetical protein